MPNLYCGADENLSEVRFGDICLNANRLDLRYFENRLPRIHENAWADETLGNDSVDLGVNLRISYSRGRTLQTCLGRANIRRGLSDLLLSRRCSCLGRSHVSMMRHQLRLRLS